MHTEILQRHASANLRVYVIWLATFPGDHRRAWDASLITDPRVTHFWDEEGTVGRWFGEQHYGLQGRSVPVVSDVYYLYGAEAVWDRVPLPLISSGYTVIATIRQLQTDILRALTN